MAYVALFQPQRGANQVLTPSSSSAAVTIDKVATSVRLYNSGANICHVRIGTSVSGAAATVADMPVGATKEIIVRKAEGEDTLSYISSAGTTLHIQTGEGGA